MNDPVLSKHLPNKQQLSGRLPERDFFFGVLCTLRQQYMKDIIADASQKKFKITDDDPKKSGILISETWMQELMKHPYHSSKLWLLTAIGKPGTGIFLMKERAKLYKVHKGRTMHNLLKKLGDPAAANEEAKAGEQPGQKRKNLGGGQYAPVGS